MIFLLSPCYYTLRSQSQYLFLMQQLKPYGIGVATGEMCQNRVMFKQFLMSGGMQFCQIDSCRLGGVNENIAVMLMAEKLNSEY